MNRPASITFYGTYFLVFAAACIARGLWGIGELPLLYAGTAIGWGLWAGFCAIGLFLHDDPCRRGLVWIAGGNILGSLLVYLSRVDQVGLEGVFGNPGPLHALFAVNLVLSFAALFVLSNWKALRYCHAQGAH